MYLGNNIKECLFYRLKQTVVFFILLFVSIVSYAQCLISNGGFERFRNPCALYFNLPNDTNGVINGYNPFFNTFSTPDVFNQCIETAGFPCEKSACTPQNIYGYQQTHSGKGYIGIITYWSPPPAQIYREYIELRLDEYMSKDICYHFKMYCSFGDSCGFICPTIGALFSDTFVKGTIASPTENYIWQPAQIVNNTNNWDSVNWFKVEGDYLAHGGEKYITIGNFWPDLNSIIYPYHSNTQGSHNPFSYLYIDDVSLIPCEADTVHGEHYSLCYGDSITLKLDSLAPMPTSPCNASLNYCHWYDKRHTPLFSGFNYTIKPTRDTVLYTIRGNDTCSCGYYQDSFVIHVVPPVGNEKNHYDTLCAGETKQLTADTLQATYQWYNYSNVLVANTKAYTVNPVNSTKYYLILQDSLQLCASRTDTFNIQVLDPPCAKIAIPTAFSPNGDGNNDVFAPIFYQNKVAEMQMRIYNRWGEIVYNGNGAWDGKYKGVLQPNDTYFYVVEIKGEYFKGNVELLK